VVARHVVVTVQGRAHGLQRAGGGAEQDRGALVLVPGRGDPGQRQAHLTGQIAAALGEATETKLSVPPVIAPVDLLGAKVS
jgi:hypothetical protein